MFLLCRAVFPLKLGYRGKYHILIQEYRVNGSENYIIDYCSSSPRKHKCKCFTYLKKFPGNTSVERERERERERAYVTIITYPLNFYIHVHVDPW